MEVVTIDDVSFLVGTGLLMGSLMASNKGSFFFMKGHKFPIMHCETDDLLSRSALYSVAPDLRAF